MITTISKRISHFLCAKKIIPAEDMEIYQYGFEIIVSTVIAALIVLLIGILLNTIGMAILFCIIFSVLRQMTGGYHADSYFKCNLSFGILSFIVLLLTKTLSQGGLYSLHIHLLLLLFSVLVIAVYAPVEHHNKPLDDSQRKQNRIYSIVFASLLSAVSLACLEKYMKVSILIGLTLFLVAMLILILKMKRKEEEV